MLPSVHLSAISFHETKNLISGEGGALIINDPSFIERAEVIREKGTDRSRFFRGEVDKYTWQDIGSSYLPSDILAAFLLAQLEQADRLLTERLGIWDRYHAGLARLEDAGALRRPGIPQGCAHNGHLYYVLTRDLPARAGLIAHLKARGIGALFHYVPLHSAPAGKRYGRAHGALPVTDNTAERLARMPMWHGLGEQQAEVISAVESYFA